MYTKFQKYLNKIEVKNYRKKPIVVQATRYESIEQIKISFPNIEVRDDNRASRAISLKSLEGRVELQVGDYIIKGIKGEYYPCKPDIFEESYERV
uniref:PGDYG protein n=1 Tax=Myoviridae sp. ctBtT5 TaxID=2825048 RepID=A0A8S5PZQ5_9CAUD|nr:MAG TPA: PGDYG protein [Myoviridae sp. ctBtT5]